MLSKQTTLNYSVLIDEDPIDLKLKSLKDLIDNYVMGGCRYNSPKHHFFNILYKYNQKTKEHT